MSFIIPFELSVMSYVPSSDASYPGKCFLRLLKPETVVHSASTTYLMIRFQINQCEILAFNSLVFKHLNLNKFNNNNIFLK